MNVSAHPHSGLTLSEVLGTAAVDPKANNTFALVDGALLRDLPAWVQRSWPVSQARSLLTGGTGAGAAEVGPLLFQLTQDDMAAELPPTLLDETTGRSAGSFLVSGLALNDMASQLMPFVDVKLADQSTMVMRFYDPRVLPFWLALVRPAYSNRFAAALARWIFWDARQSLVVEHFQKSEAATDDADLPWRIDDTQEQHLLDACYPFALIERFRLEDPAALARVPVTDRYGFFNAQIERARCHGIEGSGDIETYCGLAIELGVDFDQDEALHARLLRVKGGANLAEELAKVSDLDWKRMRGPK